MKTRFAPFLLMALMVLMNASSAQSVTKGLPATCDVVGMVVNVKQVQQSPYRDGTPTRMATIETHIDIRIDDRKPHSEKDDAAGQQCKKKNASEKRTYKVCSPTAVKAGDRISGTEASLVGSGRSISCIFDLVIVAPKQ